MAGSLAAQAAEVPAYVPEFASQYLKPLISPIADHVKMAIEKGPNDEPVIRLRVMTPKGPQGSALVYSEYRIHFVDGEIPRVVPEVDVHRFIDKSGKFLHPEVTGRMDVAVAEGQIIGRETLPGRLRSLFRADYTLHPLFKNPITGAQKKSLSQPQMEALAGVDHPEGRQPGLLDFYKQHLGSGLNQPLHMAAILPTGVGKTILAIKYLDFVQALNEGKRPVTVFVVQNKQILDDVAQKFQEMRPELSVVRLYGGSTGAELTADTSLILATRSTYHKRRDEIHRHIQGQLRPVVMFRDEAHHTGRDGGQFEAILKSFLETQNSRSQVIDLTATPWHEDQLDLTRQYKGQVATSFVSFDEYQRLLAGEDLGLIARVQALRAIFQGWLAPLEEVSFITKSSAAEPGATFRTMLLNEQRLIESKLHLTIQSSLQAAIEDLDPERLSELRTAISRIHTPITSAVFEDLRNNFRLDQSLKVAEYDRGLIFVPTILHAEIYQRLLTALAKGENMEFRVIHSKMVGNGDNIGKNIDWLNDLDKSHTHRHKYLINVAMAREGVDIPGVNRIAFVTATDSVKVLIQVLGRATRIKPKKSGIRLTDFSGSYLRYFQELPAPMLQSLFPRTKSEEPSPGLRPKTSVPRALRYDGKALAAAELLDISVEDPMAELERLENRDSEKLKAQSASPNRDIKQTSEASAEKARNVVFLSDSEAPVEPWRYFPIPVDDKIAIQNFKKLETLDWDEHLLGSSRIPQYWRRVWNRMDPTLVFGPNPLTDLTSRQVYELTGISKLFISIGLDSLNDPAEIQWFSKPVSENLLQRFSAEAKLIKVQGPGRHLPGLRNWEVVQFLPIIDKKFSSASLKATIPLLKAFIEDLKKSEDADLIFPNLRKYRIQDRDARLAFRFTMLGEVLREKLASAIQQDPRLMDSEDFRREGFESFLLSREKPQDLPTSEVSQRPRADKILLPSGLVEELSSTTQSRLAYQTHDFFAEMLKVDTSRINPALYDPSLLPKVELAYAIDVLKMYVEEAEPVRRLMGSDPEFYRWLLTPIDVPRSVDMSLRGFMRKRVIGKRIRNFNLVPLHLFRKTGGSFSDMNDVHKARESLLQQVVSDFEAKEGATEHFNKAVDLFADSTSEKEMKNLVDRFFGHDRQDTKKQEGGPVIERWSRISLMLMGLYGQALLTRYSMEWKSPPRLLSQGELSKIKVFRMEFSLGSFSSLTSLAETKVEGPSQGQDQERDQEQPIRTVVGALRCTDLF